MILYKTQFDKLTSAYIAGKVDPYSACGCFVGNLLNNSINWVKARDLDLKVAKDQTTKTISKECVDEESNNSYSLQEIYDLERIFLRTYRENNGDYYAFDSIRGTGATKQDEDALFIAFEKTLEYLKQLHISKGEVIDEIPVFEKRAFQTV